MGKIAELIARKNFDEMKVLEKLINAFGDRARVKELATVEFSQLSFPLHSVTVGSTNPADPCLALFGGVHGLEKIGSEVVLSYMELILELMQWDEMFQERLKKSRIVFMPIVNPIGVVLRSRANGNGIDLMRNSPLDAQTGPINPVFSGHRISNKLPWYRGELGKAMEVEAQAMIKLVEDEVFPSSLSICVDVHSGFGAQDRFWFPFAHSQEPFPNLAEVTSLKDMFDKTYPHHFYIIEPVSRNYLINGDLWDYMYLNYQKTQQSKKTPGLFLPWTLEMGSWMWLRKNPRQLFNPFGLFHPIQPHRHHRIMRRHITLLDFLHRSILSPKSWLGSIEENRSELEQKAKELWYSSK
jgi:hypothetical protein